MASVRKFLTANLVKRLYLSTILDAQPTQPALLESAVNSPINIKHYNQQDNIFVLAAELASKIIKNHAYMDGNKRLATVAADMFLSMNGQTLRVDNNIQSIVAAHLAVANSQWTAEQLATFYHSIATPSVYNSNVMYYFQHAEEY
jgi:death-on-curing family protein